MRNSKNGFYDYRSLHLQNPARAMLRYSSPVVAKYPLVEKARKMRAFSAGKIKSLDRKNQVPKSGNFKSLSG
jgi:hypothetical protein